jgi:hypothetical protein
MAKSQTIVFRFVPNHRPMITALLFWQILANDRA